MKNRDLQFRALDINKVLLPIVDASFNSLLAGRHFSGTIPVQSRCLFRRRVNGSRDPSLEN